MAEVTINVAQQPSVLSDFPVFIDLSDIASDNPFWMDVTRDNLRAFDSNGGTQLPLDIYALDTGTQTGVIIVKRTLSDNSTTTIFLDTNGITEAAPSDPLGAEAVWSDYTSVIFDHNPVDRTDFTAFVNDNSVIPRTSERLPFNGVGFNGSSDSMESRVIGNSNVFTMAAHAVRDAGSSNHAIISYNSGGLPNERATIAFRNTGNLEFWDNINSWTPLSAPVAWANGTEYRVAGRHDGAGNRAFFVNGVLSGSESGISDIDVDADEFWMGAEDGTFNEALGNPGGMVGFGYIRFEALSDDWLAAEATNLSDTATFYAVEAVVNPDVRVTQSTGYALAELANNARITQGAGYALAEGQAELRVTQSIGYALAGAPEEPAELFAYDDPGGCSQLLLDEINALFVAIENDLNDRLDRDGSKALLDALPVNYQRIINLAEATASTDAVTYGQAKRIIGGG